MIITAGLIFGASLFAWSIPGLLRRTTKAGSDPTTAIWYWLVSIAAVLGTCGVGIVLLLLPGDGLADLAVGCWTALRHGQAPELDEVVGATGLAVLLVAAGRFVHAAVRRMRSRRRIHQAHLNYLNVVGPPDTAPPHTIWLDHTEPLAYSLAGRPGLIVASIGLRRLPAAQVTAVISHERAHLRGRHHQLMAVTDALAKALPFVPLFRQAPSAIRLLVELSADAAAVHACGPHAVRGALLALDGQQTPAQALAMAGDAVPMRLQRISQPQPAAHIARQALTRAGTGLALAALPAFIGIGTVVVAAGLSCPAG